MSPASHLRASWREVTQHEGAPKARSSHAVAVVGHKAFVFGGEFEPRVPIDNLVHVFDLETRTWSVAPSEGEPPLPRVGVTMAVVDEVIYVFAGRDKEHEELNEFYSYSTATGEWKLLSREDTSPPHRSYHAMAADEDRKKLYTFGGCGKNGRLSDLWVFDIATGEWKVQPTPPPESKLIARGGPGLAVVNGELWVIFGFNDVELSDIHRFDPETSTWEKIETSGEKFPGRSVFGTAAVDKYIIIYGGEIDPSDLGHMGAGAFSSEVYVLDSETRVWIKPEVTVEEGSDPGARGWYAAASFGKSMLVYGGNSESNDRLDDMYVLTLTL